MINLTYETCPHAALRAQSAGLSELFAEQAGRTPRNVAVRYDGRGLTYAALYQKAQRLACVLQSKGVQRDSLVAICGERSPDYIVAILATVIAGGAYLPIDPALPQQRIDLILDDAKPVVVLAAQSVADHFSNSKAVAVGLEEAAWAPFCGYALPVTFDSSPADLAYVMYTSGSTGVPKGACITQRAVIRLVCGADYATFGPEVSILQNSPLSFDASTFEIWGSLLNGGTCVLMHYQKPSLQQIEEVLVTERVSTLFLTTALFLELVERLPRAFRDVKEVLTGGEPIPPAAVKRALNLNPGLNVIACYGPTECTTFASTHRYTSAAQVGDVIPLGAAIAQTELYVLNDDLSVAAVGEEGELYVGGTGLARCYLNRPDLTAQAFVRNPFSNDPQSRLYRTGDRCAYASDGSLLFKGRLDRQIKLRGFRIELGEVEATLHQHPAVHSAVVKTERTSAGDKVIVAYVVPRADAVAPDFLRDEEIFAERTREWQQVYSKLLYKSLATSDLAGNDPTFNTTGWKSTFDGRHIPPVEMEEQVGQAVDRILALSPRNVLEIGCGTGMLLFRLAPHCESYVGTDFSPDALTYVQERLNTVPGANNVSLFHRMAHEFPEPPDGKGFDVVILNSVSEHFSSLQYLDQLLDGIAGIVRPGGYVFVGDNRNFPLLPLFHAAVQLVKNPATLSVPAFSLVAEQSAGDEQQLTIDPYFFAQVDRTKYGRVSLQLKRGSHYNELTGYRFDALLQVGGGDEPVVDPGARAWRAGTDSLASVRTLLEAERPEQLILTNAPNRRLAGSRLLLDAVHGNTTLRTVGELKRAMDSADGGEDPEHFWRLGAALGYDVQVLPSREGADGQFDVVFRRDAASLLDVATVSASRGPKPLQELANDPLLSWRKEQLGKELRQHLEARVPEHAVPSFFVVLPRFVLTANGKIDTAALPLPARLRSADAAVGESEGTTLERQIRSVWESILGVRNISLDEKFFEIGGDSLKAVKVASDLSQALHLDVSPALLFEAPTIRGLAARVLQLGSAPAAVEKASSSVGQKRRALAQPRRASATAV